jgi:molybdenum cofactor cytidylyltransferase
LRTVVRALVLAAGASTRMGGAQKLLEELEGEPLVRRAVRAAMESKVESVTVVLGHDAEAVRSVLPSGPTIVVNDAPEEGLSSSLRVGLGSTDAETDGIVVLLGDMPLVEASDVDALIDAWMPGDICVATHRGQRGNPVLWPLELRPEMMAIRGDRGAKTLMASHAPDVREVELGASVTVDIDTPADLEAARGHG